MVAKRHAAGAAGVAGLVERRRGLGVGLNAADLADPGAGEVAAAHRGDEVKPGVQPGGVGHVLVAEVDAHQLQAGFGQDRPHLLGRVERCQVPRLDAVVAGLRDLACHAGQVVLPTLPIEDQLDAHSRLCHRNLRDRRRVVCPPAAGEGPRRRLLSAFHRAVRRGRWGPLFGWGVGEASTATLSRLLACLGPRVLECTRRDPSSWHTQPPMRAGARAWQVEGTGCVAIGTFMSTLIPARQLAMPHEFQVEITTVEWVAMAYMLTVTGLLISLAGSQTWWVGSGFYNLGPLISRRIALCALAGDRGVDRRARGSGVGAAMLAANGAAILTSAFPAPSAVRQWASTGTIVGAGLTVGPSLGGVLITLSGGAASSPSTCRLAWWPASCHLLAAGRARSRNALILPGVGPAGLPGRSLAGAQPRRGVGLVVAAILALFGVSLSGAHFLRTGRGCPTRR